MEYGSETLARLIKLFSRMPGIGQKTAQRLALHLLRARAEDVERLGRLVETELEPGITREAPRQCLLAIGDGTVRREHDTPECRVGTDLATRLEHDVEWSNVRGQLLRIRTDLEAVAPTPDPGPAGSVQHHGTVLRRRIVQTSLEALQRRRAR